MSRITLKVTKPVDPAAPPKALSSRAKRALQGKKLPKMPTPTPAPAVAPASNPPIPAAATNAGSPLPQKSRRRTRSKSGAAHGGSGEARGESNVTSARRDRSPAASPNAPKPPSTRPPERRRGATPPKPQRATPHATPRVIRHENPDDPRLSKRMSEMGLCSRREADEWIENGWVKVDGNVITTLGIRVSPHARIDIDKAAAQHQSEQVTILLNKPIGYVSGQAEHGYEPASVLIKPENRWPADPSPIRFKPSHLRGLAPAGRLDIDSTGLLVFTQDGRIAKHLVGRDSEVEKEYLVRVEGTLSKENMKLLHHGLELDGVTLKPAKVSWQNEDQLRFVLREGRKRQIRRMCELVGLVVTGLTRVRSGGVPLGPLPVGQWRYLQRNESF
jgi:23S rRNA pseudouridine2604 synthase